MALPSIDGCCSNRMSSFNSSATASTAKARFAGELPRRPRNRTVSLTLSPFPMNWRTLRNLASKSCVPMFGPEPYFLQFVALLGFAGLAFLLRREVSELSVVQQPRDRGIGVRRHFHQVKVIHPRPGEGVGHRHHAKLLAIFSNYSYPRDAYLFIDLYCLAMASPPWWCVA